MNIKNFKNKIFLYFDKFRKHRIFEKYDSITGSILYYCQYRTLLTKKWKTYQTYNKDGLMQRAVFGGTHNNISYMCAENFMNSLKDKMFIGWNNFKK